MQKKPKSSEVYPGVSLRYRNDGKGCESGSLLPRREQTRPSRMLPSIESGERSALRERESARQRERERERERAREGSGRRSLCSGKGRGLPAVEIEGEKTLENQHHMQPLSARERGVDARKRGSGRERKGERERKG